jgi:hypothetical protein
VYINKNKAGNFVLSNYANKNNKPAHLFWSWSAIILVFIIPIILIFISWKYSILSIIIGLIINSAVRKSAEQFVLQDMLDIEY